MCSATKTSCRLSDLGQAGLPKCTTLHTQTLVYAQTISWTEDRCNKDMKDYTCTHSH